MLNGKTVLLTGGTGSFGKRFTKIVLDRFNLKKLIIFSRDELKQYEMQQIFNEEQYPNIRFFIGDVRDRDRLYRSFEGVDIVIHAAALKQVPTAEYNPFEVVKTNVIGAANIIDAAIDCGIHSVIGLSSDKAANPINLYGATKLCSDKIFVAGNSYTGTKATRFSVVRYGNVIGSRGSVAPLFIKMKNSGRLPITDIRMTRFWITLEQGVEFVLKSLERMRGGEIFLPKIPSMRVVDLARVIAPECELDVIGIRPGEKIHEVMVTEDDAYTTLEYDDYFAIMPAYHEWDDALEDRDGGKPCPEGFRYSSDSNSEWLSDDEMLDMIKNIPALQEELV